MPQIVLATDNPGKIRELNALLVDLAVEALPQSAFQAPAAEETALTFVENALFKARNAARYSGLPAIADDSGLLVDALGSAPGVYSARYAGPDASDQDNITKLLVELQAVPAAQRTARFFCALVYLRCPEDPVPLICQGVWEGLITHAPRGSRGFGYDPVFLVPAEGKTAAELAPSLKNRLSHRGQALAQLADLLPQRFPHG